MSRPRFLVDHDFNEDIIDGVARREPAIDFIFCRDVGLSERPDAEVLEYAAAHGRIVLSHDVNTMIAAAWGRIASRAGSDIAVTLPWPDADDSGQVRFEFANFRAREAGAPARHRQEVGTAEILR